MTILSGSGEEESHARAQELAEDIRASTKQFMKFTVTLGIGTICRELQDIRYSCRASEATGIPSPDRPRSGGSYHGS